MQFFEGDDGELVGELKTLSGGWSEMSPVHETIFCSAGYKSRTRTEWRERSGSELVPIPCPVICCSW